MPNTRKVGPILRLDIERVLDQARSENWRQLAIVDAGLRLSDQVDDWPDNLRLVGRCFRSSATPEKILRMLESLPGLSTLVVWNHNIGSTGARAIVASLPRLSSLDLTGCNIGIEGVRVIAASLPELRSLDLSGNNVNDDDVRTISGALQKLTSLSLGSNNIGDEGARVIAAELPSLMSLNLGGNNIGAEGAKALAASLRGLISLDLHGNSIGVEGAQVLSARLTDLTTLNLSGCGVGDEGTGAIATRLLSLKSLNLGNNRIGVDGAKAIAASLHELNELVLWDNKIGSEGTEAIAASLHGLTSLDLWANYIGEAGAVAIAGSLRKLRSLDLDRNDIGDEGAEAIATSLSRLKRLSVGSNKISLKGIRAIAISLNELTTLNAGSNDFGAEGASIIAASLPGLTFLTLGGIDLGESGARAIAASLKELTSLNLWRCNIGDEGATAIALSLFRLTSLRLDENKISAVGAKAIATSLRELSVLSLSENEIGAAGARAIAASLVGLVSLNLAGNNIGPKGAKAIAASLGALTVLDLEGNDIGPTGAEAIATSLPRLASLDLGKNNVGDAGAKAVGASLRELITLDLGNNGIGAEGARAIAALTGLTSLSLGTNKIGDEGARSIAGSLRGLARLILWNNDIGDEGAKAIAAKMHRLSSLSLWENRVGDEGARAIAASLSGLSSLDLEDNKIGDGGARAIAASLSGLRRLVLSNNSIGLDGVKAILDAWSSTERLGRLEELDIRKNGDLVGFLPSEVIETTDAQALLAAYRSFAVARQKQSLLPLNELKLIVVGNEAVGKTSLLRYLITGQPRNPGEVKTPGLVQHEKIEIQEWSPLRSQVRVNVWDFGGQEMMRGTHRFFLTQRSLYLLVLEDRRQDDRSIFDWMKTICNRGGASPVIVVINKSDAGKQDLRLDESNLQSIYPNIIAFLRTSCDPSEWGRTSIERLREAIVAAIASNAQLRHVHDPIPVNWLRIKDRVSKMARERSVLAHGEFISLCSDSEDNESLVQGDEQRALLSTLHELGVVVAHGLDRNAPAVRREINLLDPNWLTGAVYRVMDKAGSVDQEGEFLRNQLSVWLDPDLYPPERHEFILDMMQDRDIGLCFRLPTSDERYLLPEALPASRRYYGQWPADALRFRFAYGYLPPGLIPRFIVQSHRNLTESRARWRTGVVLRVRDCEVLVLADVDRRRVDIQVVGPTALRRAALNVVLNDIEVVHALNPEADPVAVVPLPDIPDVHVSYQHLLKLEELMGRNHPFIPDGANRAYEVQELLDGVRVDHVKRLGSNDGLMQNPAKPHLVILIHGIRTMALWQNELRKSLEREGFKVQPTNYGYFDVLRFLFPWQLFAWPIVNDITKQVRHAIAMNKGADCSIIAHSFGTFVAARILRDETDLDFNRIIFCGSVVSQGFRFENYRKRFAEPLMNEVGTQDFLPVLAEIVTFGYGSAGAFGFRRPAVRDRWHNGKSHSAFLNRAFCEKYWAKFLRDGEIVEDEEEAQRPAWWVRLLSQLKIKYGLVLAVAYLTWRSIA